MNIVSNPFAFIIIDKYTGWIKKVRVIENVSSVPIKGCIKHTSNVESNRLSKADIKLICRDSRYNCTIPRRLLLK